MEAGKVFLTCFIVFCIKLSFSQEANSCYPEIPCDNGECIGRENWCDDFSDCYDESDEKYCLTKRLFSTPDNKCNESLHFVCRNRKCIPRALVCDIFKDCDDNSDEEKCVETKEERIETVSTTTEWMIPEPYPTLSRPIDIPVREIRRVSPDPHTTYYRPQTHPPLTHDLPAPVDLSAGRHWSVIHQTRFPQSIRKKERRRTWPLPAFHFQTDRAQSFGRIYGREASRAEQWLLSVGWKEDTPRALVALSLAGNSFHPKSTDYDVMKRRLKLEFGAKLLRDRENRMNNHQLAMYINALLATCQDPRHIYNQDTVSLLYDRTHDPRRRTQPTPYIVLTLCLANGTITMEDFTFLKHIVTEPVTDESSKDRFILSITALACIYKRGLYVHELSNGLLGTAFSNLLEQEYDDGSFGSKYTTALAAQAFIALDVDIWNPDKIMDFLISKQLNNGSFGGMLATLYILPVLSGKSLIHLRNIQCEKPEYETSSEESDVTEQKKTILYSLAIGHERRNSITLKLTVPVGANFFEIMQEAQKLQSEFRFLYTESFGKIDVHTISGVPNDPERGTYWQLYVLNWKREAVETRQIYTGDIRNLIPEDNQELLYWYLPYKGILS